MIINDKRTDYLSPCFCSLQPGKLTEAFKYFIQGMGYSKYTVRVTFEQFLVPRVFVVVEYILPPCGEMSSQLMSFDPSVV